MLFSSFDFGSREDPTVPPSEGPSLTDPSQTLDEIEQSIRHLENMWKVVMEMRSKIRAIGMEVADLREEISRLTSSPE